MDNNSKIVWGSLIAGAAIVVGAALVAPTIIDKVPLIGDPLVQSVQTISQYILSLFVDTSPAALASTEVANATTAVAAFNALQPSTVMSAAQMSASQVGTMLLNPLGAAATEIAQQMNAPSAAAIVAASNSAIAANNAAAAAASVAMQAKLATMTAVGKVAGVAMIGGGATYLMSGKSEMSESQHHRREAHESFAMKHEMQKMQALQLVQAAAVGVPEAQAMLAKQRGGRG